MRPPRPQVGRDGCNNLLPDGYFLFAGFTILKVTFRV